MKKTTLTALAVVMSGMALPSAFAHTCTSDGKSGLLPESDARIEVGALNVSDIDETKFNAIIDKVIGYYTPVVAAKGGHLVVDKKWADGTVNAFATRNGKEWKVTMFGGLARHPKVTEDGLALAVCHELGHHLGGAPKISGFFGRTGWASNEGEADYFATLKCLRNVWAKDDNTLQDVPLTVTQACQKSFSKDDEIRICERSALAGQSVANLFAASATSKAAPSFDTPDQSKVRKTFNGHPEAQCRMDTYFAGAICEKGVTEAMNDKDVTAGACSMEKGESIGIRPLCWYKPKK